MKIQRLISMGLIFAALSSVQNSSAVGVTDGVKGISMSIYQSNWHAVQDIFITQPKEASKQAYWPMIPSAAGFLSFGAATAVASWFLLKPLAEKFASVVWPIGQTEFNGEGGAGTTRKTIIYSPALMALGTVGAAIGGWKLVDKLCRYRSLNLLKESRWNW